MKKTVAALLSLAMVLGGTASAAGSAGTLASLGLFRGTDKGYELERTATRAEIAVTLVRLLGKEEKAAGEVFVLSPSSTMDKESTLSLFSFM